MIVATDDRRIADVASAFGAEVAVTGHALSGTHRVAQVVPNGSEPFAVVAVQADQPLLPEAHLAAILARLRAGADVCTLSAPLQPADLGEPARVKVLVDDQGRATRFTRAPEPGARLHVGLYGFGPGWIHRCVAAPRGPRTVAHDLEQLAWLDAGIAIHVDPVEIAAPSVDTPADLERVRAIIEGGATQPHRGGPRPSAS